jgi:hypothetical protein
LPVDQLDSFINVKIYSRKVICLPSKLAYRAFNSEVTLFQ